MFVVQVQLKEVHGGLNGSTAYICGGEGLFPIKRLSQMAKHFEAKADVPVNTLLSQIHIEQSHNIEEVLDILVRAATLLFSTGVITFNQTMRIPEMCRTKGIRLLIIDRSVLNSSITVVVDRAQSGGALAQRVRQSFGERHDVAHGCAVPPGREIEVAVRYISLVRCGGQSSHGFRPGSPLGRLLGSGPSDGHGLVALHQYTHHAV